MREYGISALIVKRHIQMRGIGERTLELYMKASLGLVVIVPLFFFEDLKEISMKEMNTQRN